MKIKNLKIGTKYIISFSIILIIMTGVNAFSLAEITALKNRVDIIISKWMQSAIAISDLNVNTSNLRINQLQHAYTTDETSKRELEQNMIGLIDKIIENQDTYEPLLTDPTEIALYREFEEKWERYNELGYQFLDLSLSNENLLAVELLNDEARNVFDDFSNDLKNLVVINHDNSLETSTNVERIYNRHHFIITTLLVATFIFSAIIAIVLVRHITVPVKQLAIAAGKVADGDYNIQLDILNYDEVGDLTQSFNQMANSLQLAGEKIHKQQDELQTTNSELSNKTILLEKQKLEIEEKNSGLEEALIQLKETQHQLVMKEKMASLGNLVAGVAHEINNPIGAVFSAADTSVRSINMVVETLENSGYLTDIMEDKKFSCALDILKKTIQLC